MSRRSGLVFGIPPGRAYRTVPSRPWPRPEERPQVLAAGSTGLEPATSGFTVSRRVSRTAIRSEASSERRAVTTGGVARLCTASPPIPAQIPHTVRTSHVDQSHLLNRRKGEAARRLSRTAPRNHMSLKFFRSSIGLANLRMVGSGSRSRQQLAAALWITNFEVANAWATARRRCLHLHTVRDDADRHPHVCAALRSRALGTDLQQHLFRHFLLLFLLSIFSCGLLSRPPSCPVIALFRRLLRSATTSQVGRSGHTHFPPRAPFVQFAPGIGGSRIQCADDGWSSQPLLAGAPGRFVPFVPGRRSGNAQGVAHAFQSRKHDERNRHSHKQKISGTGVSPRGTARRSVRAGPRCGGPPTTRQPLRAPWRR